MPALGAVFFLSQVIHLDADFGAEGVFVLPGGSLGGIDGADL
jgi:hypothetical protein